MTEQELIQGYETEIHYQKHMIENLGRWNRPSSTAYLSHARIWIWNL